MDDASAFCLGGRDRLEPSGVCEGKPDVQMLEEIGEPVPAAGGFHHGFVASEELGEAALES